MTGPRPFDFRRPAPSRPFAAQLATPAPSAGFLPARGVGQPEGAAPPAPGPAFPPPSVRGPVPSEEPLAERGLPPPRSVQRGLEFFQRPVSPEVQNKPLGRGGFEEQTIGRETAFPMALDAMKRFERQTGVPMDELPLDTLVETFLPLLTEDQQNMLANFMSSGGAPAEAARFVAQQGMIMLLLEAGKFTTEGAKDPL